MATYYVSTSGLYSNVGSQAAPWNLAKMQDSLNTLVAGDEVLLNGTDTFINSTVLISGVSGIEGNRIKFGTYGVGKPKFLGGVIATGWVDLGNGIWESVTIPEVVNRTMVVTVNDTTVDKASFPKRAKSHEAYLYATQEQLTTATPVGSLGRAKVTMDELSQFNLVGSEIIARKEHWIIDTHVIHEQNGNEVTYVTEDSTNHTYGWGAYGGILANTGFYLTNNSAFVGGIGANQYEWFFDKTTKKLKMYFGATNPNTLEVKVSTQDSIQFGWFETGNSIYGWKILNCNYIDIENIEINTVSHTGLFVRNSNYTTLDGIVIKNTGNNGLSLSYEDNYCTNITIKNCNISNTANNGILSFGTDIIIEDNILHNIALIESSLSVGDNQSTGIRTFGTNVYIRRNDIQWIGYNGIDFAKGNHIYVLDNLVEHMCQHKIDGGGIYSFGHLYGTVTTPTNQIIDNNIINGYNDFGGWGWTNTGGISNTQGIYLDDMQTAGTFTNNKIYGCQGAGIVWKQVDSFTVTDNLVFGSLFGIHFGNGHKTYTTQHVALGPTVVSNNTVINRKVSDKHIGWEDGARGWNDTQNPMANLNGTWSNNKWITPFGYDALARLIYRVGDSAVGFGGSGGPNEVILLNYMNSEAIKAKWTNQEIGSQTIVIKKPYNLPTSLGTNRAVNPNFTQSTTNGQPVFQQGLYMPSGVLSHEIVSNSPIGNALKVWVVEPNPRRSPNSTISYIPVSAGSVDTTHKLVRFRIHAEEAVSFQFILSGNNDTSTFSTDHYIDVLKWFGTAVFTAKQGTHDYEFIIMSGGNTDRGLLMKFLNEPSLPLYFNNMELYDVAEPDLIEALDYVKWEQNESRTATKTVVLDQDYLDLEENVVIPAGDLVLQPWSAKVLMAQAEAIPTLPSVNAGPNQTLPNGTTVVSLNGTITDADSILWTKFSGPSSFTITTPTTEDTTVTGLEEGVYVFRATATNVVGSDYDDVTITVEGEVVVPSEDVILKGKRILIS